MKGRHAALMLLLAGSPAPAALAGGSGPSEHALDLRELPQRPKPLLELGDRFLGRGAISKGFTLPSGATWQPSVLAWGRLRTALQAERRGGATISEWAHGLDLNGQLSLTPTERPKPLLELGDRFLGRGAISKGFTLPTGATWQPSVLAWGRLRTALQAERRGGATISEWANGLDLNGQLSLTPTERLVLSFRPWSERRRAPVGSFSSADGGGLERGLRLAPVSLYFEGDLGELFPKLDARSPTPLDLGLVLGRAPFALQDGLLLDSTLTGLGISKTALAAGPFSNLRLAAWHAGPRPAGGKGDAGRRRLTALSTEADWHESTVGLDLVHLGRAGGGDGLYLGFNLRRRIAGRWNAAFRLLSSHALQRADAAVNDGLLTTAAFSTVPRGTPHLAYLNLAASFGDFTPAEREARLGGPLGAIGILFSGPGLGGIGSPLSANVEPMVAAALGLQLQSPELRRQTVVELAGRLDRESGDGRELGVGLRFQQALGRRFVLRVDAHGVACRGEPPAYGARSELLLKF